MDGDGMSVGEAGGPVLFNPKTLTDQDMDL